MIRNIKFNHYRKLKEIEIDFDRTVNVISGTNGTCKSTLMHIISNSFQALKGDDSRFLDPRGIDILKTLTDKVNPKIESISRGDKETYRNPAAGRPGTLFTVMYQDNMELDFRRHNSSGATKQNNFRFAIKPKYAADTEERLPAVPVVYLGLARLFPYGELSDANAPSRPKGKLPDHLHDEFVKQYKALTSMEVVQAVNQHVVGVKKRNDFVTTVPGIDSNTISSGEDNVSIILTALMSLRFVTECIDPNSASEIESILLIDEFDATLHPSVQKKIFELISKYSTEYRIQVFFTTHSLYLLKEAYEKARIIYLVDQIDHVSIMPDPGPLQIEMHLNNQAYSAIYKNVFIPVYTEDAEARFFLDRLLDYISKTIDTKFARARNLLHLVDANIGSDSLKNLFTDRKLGLSSMRAICILDGDQSDDKGKHIITLPGDSNPEKVLASYAKRLVTEDTHKAFWNEAQQLGFSRQNSLERIEDFDKIAEHLATLKAAGKSTHGVERVRSKAHFNRHRDFYEIVVMNWLVADENRAAIEKFRQDLHTVFLKTAAFYSIDKGFWPREQV